MEEDLIINKINNINNVIKYKNYKTLWHYDKFNDDAAKFSCGYQQTSGTTSQTGDGSFYNMLASSANAYNKMFVITRVDLTNSEIFFGMFNLTLHSNNLNQTTTNLFCGLSKGTNNRTESDYVGISTDGTDLLFVSKYNGGVEQSTVITSYFNKRDALINYFYGYNGSFDIMYDGTKVYLYVNGILAATHTTSMRDTLYPSFAVYVSATGTQVTQFLNFGVKKMIGDVTQ